MRAFVFFLLSLFLLLGHQAIAIVTITENNKGQSQDLSGKIFYYNDIEGSLSFEELLKPAFKQHLTLSESPIFNFPRDKGAQFYVFEIENKSFSAQQLILTTGSSKLEDVQFFSNSDSIVYYTGVQYNFHQRPVDLNEFVFKINLKPGQKSTYCLRVKNEYRSSFLSFMLLKDSDFYKTIAKKSVFNGGVYMMVLILLLMIAFLWNTEQDKSYVYFSLLLLTYFLNRLWRDGVLYSELWPSFPNFNYNFGQFIFTATLLFLLLWANQLFSFSKGVRTIKWLYRLTAYSLLLFISLRYFTNSTELNISIMRILTALVAGLVTYVIFSYDRKTLKTNKYYLTIISLLLIELVLAIFFRFDLRDFWGISIQFSSAFFVVMFGLMGYVLLLKYRKVQAQVLDLNKNLELQVEKRTYQLNSQKEELKSQHEELIMQKESLQAHREELRGQKELLQVKNAELEKLSLVASKTDNLIYIFNSDGELDWFNASFSAQLGISYDEYLQREKPLNIVDISNNRNIRHVLNTCLREKTVVSYETKRAEEGKDDVWFHTTLTPLLNENDEIKLLIAIDIDITTLKHFEQELDEQRKDAETQKNIAIKRKEELEERQVEITDSIRYAKRIQSGIMPKVKQIQREFPDSFVLFLPKDIVSGDFYWYHRIQDKHFVAAVDCTGHGVPGAFMSIIGNYLLNSIIIHNGVTNPDEILKQLNRKIKIALKADSRSQTSDGMDITIAVIDKTEKTVEVASALRPFYLFSGGNFIEVKGDKAPITSNISGTTISSYTNHEFDFNPGDSLYLFSDGIIDQFGGKRGKKFLTKRFKQLLFEVNPLPMAEQKTIIKAAHDDWKGNGEQVDDILVMGLRFNDDENR